MRFKIWQGTVILGAAFAMLVFSLIGAQEGKQTRVPSVITDPVSSESLPDNVPAPSQLNPTVSNDANDLRGANHLDSIVLWWSSEDRATEYIFFQSESVNGPFAEFARMPAGLEFSTNAQDINPDARTKTLCYRMEARDAEDITIREYEPVCVPPWLDDVPATSQLNPTASNVIDDLSGSNEINAITLWWGREPKATEYVFFRSESMDGPFAEVFRAPAGLEFSTNASDENPDARTKTLCYRMEARDAEDITIREYEPVCVPPWLDDVPASPQLNPTVSNDANDLRGRNLLEGIALWWSREERAAEYVFFRGDSPGGPFVERFRIPVTPGQEFSTNATDFTPDARTKTLCYRMEARDLKAKTVRTYEPVCVPPWHGE